MAAFAQPRQFFQGGALTERIANDEHAMTPAGLLTSSWQGVDDQILQAVNESAVSADFVILTNPRGSKPNRNGNIVDITAGKEGAGMRLDQYQQNPVVLWDHGFGHPFPIGTSQGPDGNLALRMQATKATATVWFDQGSEFAMDVFRLVAQKIIRMSSVGFRALKAIRLKAGDPTTEGSAVLDFEQTRRFWQIVESELMEWSVVNIGADRGALRQALDCGSVGGERLAWATQSLLKPWAEDKPTIGIGLPDELRHAFQRAVDSGIDETTLWEAVGQVVDAQIVNGTANEDEDPVGLIQSADTAEPEDTLQAAAGDVAVDADVPAKVEGEPQTVQTVDAPDSAPDADGNTDDDVLLQGIADAFDVTEAEAVDELAGIAQAVQLAFQPQLDAFTARCAKLTQQLDFMLGGLKS